MKKTCTFFYIFIYMKYTQKHLHKAMFLQDSTWKTTYGTQKHIIKEHIISQPKHHNIVCIIKSRNLYLLVKECFSRPISHLIYSSRSESIAIWAGSSFNMESTGLSTQGMIACFTASIFFLRFVLTCLSATI